MRRSAAVPVSLDKPFPAPQSRKQTRHLPIVSYLGSEVDRTSGLSTLSFSKPVGFGSTPPLHRYTGGLMAPVVDSSDAADLSERPAKPQRGAFRPQAGFKEFYFDETGDTKATSLENANGGWTGGFKLRQKDPSAESGTLSLFYKATRRSRIRQRDLHRRSRSRRAGAGSTPSSTVTTPPTR